jgi:hypothetical protein
MGHDQADTEERISVSIRAVLNPSSRGVVTQFESRSFTEFILSTAEGFRMTTPSRCHSEHSEESLLLRLC